MAPPPKSALLDSDNDAETSSTSPLLPTTNTSRKGASTTKPSLYHRLKLDYLSTAALLVIVACWAGGVGNVGSSNGESSGGWGSGGTGSGHKSATWPTNIGFEGPTPSEYLYQVLPVRGCS